jgi:hypothetical protein
METKYGLLKDYSGGIDLDEFREMVAQEIADYFNWCSKQ